MSAVAVAIVGAAAIGAVVQSQASRRAQRASERAGERGIESQERAQQEFIERTQPFADIGLSAADSISRLLGLPVQANPQIAQLQTQLADLDAQIAAGPQAAPSGGGRGDRLRGALLGGALGDPLLGAAIGGGDLGNILTGGLGGLFGGGGRRRSRPPSPETTAIDTSGLQQQRTDLQSQIDALQAADQARSTGGRQTLLEEINPLVSFLRQEGFEDIQESAAARGRLGAGGTLKDLTRFNTQLAGTIVPQLQNQRFNQLFNLLGLGSNAATGQGTAALQTGANISNLQGNIGAAQALGAQQQGQIGAGLVNQLAGIGGAAAGGAFRQPPPQPQFSTDVTNPNRFEAFT